MRLAFFFGNKNTKLSTCIYAENRPTNGKNPSFQIRLKTPTQNSFKSNKTVMSITSSSIWMISARSRRGQFAS